MNSLASNGTVSPVPRYEERERLLLLEARAALDRDRAAFEAEKKAALARRAAQTQEKVVAQGDVIELNVGGRLVSTTRGVLMQEEGMLANIFSGCWEDSVALDRTGRAFLDFDPDCFDVVLYHLRLHRLTGEAVNWNEVDGPQGKQEYFLALTDFLGLTSEEEDEGRAKAESPEPREMVHAFGTCSPNIASLDRATVTQTANMLYGWAVGDERMEQGEFVWAFRIRNLPASGEVCLGLIGVETPPPDAVSFSHGTCNGWLSGGWVQKNGVGVPGAGGWQGFHNGDAVKLRLRVDEGLLQMKVVRLGEQVFEIGGLGQHPWRVYANLYGSGSSVELLSLSQSDF